MSHETSEASLLESWIAGLVLAVGLYVAGRYLWTSFFPIGSALQVMQRLVTAGAIMFGFVLGGYVLSTTVHSVVRKAVEFPSGAFAVLALLIAWILLNGADYWRVLVFSLVLAIFCAMPLARFLERRRTIPDDQPAAADERERRKVAESNTACVILLVVVACACS